MPLALLAAVLVGFPEAPRPWSDEIVYGIIIEKFFDGDASNNHMRDRFIKDRSKYEGGFWGGDLKGVIDKLDDVAKLGVTSILLYPVMQNDEVPMEKFLPTGYRPMDYERVDKNFGDVATLRALVDAAHARNLRVILDMPITLPGFHHPYLADPAKKNWFGPKSEYGVPRWKVENPEVADYLIGVCKRWRERSGCDGFRLDSAHLQPVAFWKRFVAELESRAAGRTVRDHPRADDHPPADRQVRRRGGFRRRVRLQRLASPRRIRQEQGRGLARVRQPRGEAVLHRAENDARADRQLREGVHDDRQGAESREDDARPYLHPHPRPRSSALRRR